MSRTDNTRPYWVQTQDPLNRRFQKVGQTRWIWNQEKKDYDFGEWHYKPLTSRDCWCCTNRCYKSEIRTKRTEWRKERQELLGTWQVEQWLWEENDYYDHWSEGGCVSDEMWRYGVENQEGLRFVDFDGKYTTETLRNN